MDSILSWFAFYLCVYLFLPIFTWLFVYLNVLCVCMCFVFISHLILFWIRSLKYQLLYSAFFYYFAIRFLWKRSSRIIRISWYPEIWFHNTSWTIYKYLKPEMVVIELNICPPKYFTFPVQFIWESVSSHPHVGQLSLLCHMKTQPPTYLFRYPNLFIQV